MWLLHLDLAKAKILGLWAMMFEDYKISNEEG
jgi:hypothetical protein